MKKNLVKGLLTIMLVLTFGMTVISCDNGTTPNNNDSSGKKLTINGIDLSGTVTVILNTSGQTGTVAYGTVANVTSGNNITFNIKKVNLNDMSNPFTNTDWNESDTLYILVYNQTPQEVQEVSGPPIKTLGPVSFSDETTVVKWPETIPQTGEIVNQFWATYYFNDSKDNIIVLNKTAAVVNGTRHEGIYTYGGGSYTIQDISGTYTYFYKNGIKIGFGLTFDDGNNIYFGTEAVAVMQTNLSELVTSPVLDLSDLGTSPFDLWGYELIE